MKNIKGKTIHTDERERKVIQMKKLLALIFTFAILVSVTGIAAALVDPETGEHIKRTQIIVQRLAERLQKNPKYKHRPDKPLRKLPISFLNDSSRDQTIP